MIKKIILFLNIYLFFSTCSLFAEINHINADNLTLSLSDCYRLALKRSETIAVDSEIIKEAEAHFAQAFAQVLPNISFSLSQTRRDAASGSFVKNSAEHKFVFQQTLFSGFKEFSGIAASKAEKNQRIKEKTRSQQLLLSDVSDAFYLLIEQREDLKIMRSIERALLDRITELKDRERVGRSRRSEIVSTVAQLYDVRAEIELAKSKEALSCDLLEFLIGMPVSEISDSSFQSQPLKDELSYIMNAESRLDVQAANQALEVAKKQVTIARSGYFPTVNATGEYYTYRNTVPTNSKWDATIDVNVPIFDGRETAGKLKEARAKMKESELQLSRAKRKAVQEIRDAYAQYKIGISRARAFEKALRAAEMNYSLQREDYRLNLVSNLDCLQAIQSLENDRRDYKREFYETRRSYWQLLVAVGEINPEKL